MTFVSFLIIDDDQLDRYLLMRDLKRGGLDVKVFECRDGVEAIEFLSNFEANRSSQGKAFPPRILFLDINMPRVSGFGFLESFQKLRTQREEYAQCAVIMVSSSEHPDERVRALAYEGVVDFVIKGRTSAEELRAKVDAVLAGS
ncbi:Sensor histidine kinase TodS [Planctomycetes bacterium Poly30]|uniref:Sensor histidine kinase TodS n=1 Tax=Saltatorellus ferox TaxID=2528018 RepID=A0A518F0Y4_9BACT|nr:Sensor histidine kinase TodS [Planctomycetes bacterium Poly30]